MPSRQRWSAGPATASGARLTTVARNRAIDRAEIAALYDRPFEMVPSAVIQLNRAVAASLSEGPEALSHRTVCATTTCCRRRVGTCCAASTAVPRRPRPTGRPTTWRARMRSATPSSAAGARCRPDAGLTGRGAVVIVSPGPQSPWRDENREDG